MIEHGDSSFEHSLSTSTYIAFPAGLGTVSWAGAIKTALGGVVRRLFQASFVVTVKPSLANSDVLSIL
jgi:hypothetical protein